MNCQIYFINLFIFNYLTLNIKLFNVLCFLFKHKIFVFQKSCLSQTKENGCLWTYGRASLISDFKLTWNNDNHKSIFEVTHPVQEYTKTPILDKRYRTNTVHTF